MAIVDRRLGVDIGCYADVYIRVDSPLVEFIRLPAIYLSVHRKETLKYPNKIALLIDKVASKH